MSSIPQSPYLIYVAHRDEVQREQIAAIVRSLNHNVAFTTDSGQALITKALKEPADVMVVSEKLSDMEGIEALLAIGEVEPRPSIVLAGGDELDRLEDAMKDHVMSYLVEPITENDLKPALFLAQKRFEYLRNLEEQVETLEERLEQRKIIERAKGMLMKQMQMDEEKAHRHLQQTARSSRTKLIDVARTILETSVPAGSTNQ